MVINEQCGYVYRVTDRSVTDPIRFAPPVEAPAALLRGPRHDQFAVVGNDHSVHLMSVNADR